MYYMYGVSGPSLATYTYRVYQLDTYMCVYMYISVGAVVFEYQKVIGVSSEQAFTGGCIAQVNIEVLTA